MTNHAEKRAGVAPPAAPEEPEQTGPEARGASSFDARMQHEHLESALKDWDFNGDSDEGSDAEAVPVEQAPQPAPAEQAAPDPTQRVRCWKRLTRLNRSTIIKSAIALLAAAILGWMPVERMLAVTSTEAVINARLVTIRTPIAGEIVAQPVNLVPGTAFQSGAVLLTIKNPRADRTNLETLKRDAEKLTTETAALRAKEAVLKQHLGKMAAQKERFRAGRIETLQRQISEIDAQIASADSQHKDAAKALARAHKLYARRIVSEAFFDRVVRDESVALEQVKQLRERRKAIQIEIAAAREGTFIADGYNDTPQSAQRSLDIELELADVNARLAGTTKQIAAVQQDLAAETNRVQELSTAVIRAHVSGRIWENMSAPGEYVNAGQPLMRLLDCSSAIVTASVTESVFQKLMIGQRATFRASDGGEPIKGRIIDISGLAAVSSNDAIQSGLLDAGALSCHLEFPRSRAPLALRDQPNRSCRLRHLGLILFDPRPCASATRDEFRRNILERFSAVPARCSIGCRHIAVARSQQYDGCACLRSASVSP